MVQVLEVEGFFFSDIKIMKRKRPFECVCVCVCVLSASDLDIVHTAI